MKAVHRPKNAIRVVTAAALFDGHDASINIIRRLLQEHGAEVIHLGHNRSVADVVRAALQEGAQGICVSSYQGGHMEYFKYMKDLLDSVGASYVKTFGGGGGVIVHSEKKELEDYGITQMFHPDDGRRLGLEGMISLILESCDFPLEGEKLGFERKKKLPAASSVFDAQNPVPSVGLGRYLSLIENSEAASLALSAAELESFGLNKFRSPDAAKPPLVLGITGTGGAGKSSLIDELVQRFLNSFPTKKVAVLCVDPSKRRTGGSLLGDRIRMNSLSRDCVFMRSLASRGSGQEIARALPKMIEALKQFQFDLIIAETSGIGQGNMAITEVSDLSMYVMTSDFGAPSQLEKIDMLDYATMVAINKADRRGAADAGREVARQFRRARKIFDHSTEVPVFTTQASRFNDGGVNRLFVHLASELAQREPTRNWKIDGTMELLKSESPEHVVIPAARQGYLAEIVNTIRSYKSETEKTAQEASQLGALRTSLECLKSGAAKSEQNEAMKNATDGLTAGVTAIQNLIANSEKNFAAGEIERLEKFPEFAAAYKKPELIYHVRGKEFRQKLTRKSLSGTEIPKVVVPSFNDWGDRYRYLKLENVPGEFPYTAGVFPLKREDEDPKRMFAGEGPPERTNARFHYLCKNEPAQRLSTAFDSVTLYGQDPDLRPDIFGKVGESGVSICTLNDMKSLYAGFDLCSPNASVSMTINGPAPMILAFFFNAAIDGQLLKKEKELGRSLTSEEQQQVRNWTLQNVRGTVQADILKEDQGQNTCIFSIDFALKMMGDMQDYFIQKQVKNFYSVSISGYHIAEAGANPITQLALTLSNGFTFVEYYRSRGMKVDDFAPNLSFFFSNGLDPEYSVLGRVARRIWAVAMKGLYAANERSQKLKYHIQTSGRSLHAQEIDFNDIRTTLQALIAIYDNCNSLHTNAYDEAITTPTEESVRRAMAIQMIINREFGMTMNENPTQGAYFIDTLTDLVEEAVLDLFLSINERGGVLGAMESQFQRSRIQEESLYYETLKHSGELPIIGVNTFIDPKTLQSDYVPPKIELARASYEEKNLQLERVTQFQKANKKAADLELQKLKASVLKGENIFAALMEAAKVCSLYQMSQALYEVGGQYRRNI